MLREEDVRIDLGRCAGGRFLRVTHIPTRVTRQQIPLGGESTRVVRDRFLREIERELADRGLSVHRVPAYRRRSRDA